MNEIDRKILVQSARVIYRQALRSRDPLSIRIATRHYWLVLKTMHPESSLDVLMATTPLPDPPTVPEARLKASGSIPEGDGPTQF